jgi:ketosteroid isomerase-like protein
MVRCSPRPEQKGGWPAVSAENVEVVRTPDGQIYRGRSGVVRFFRRWLGAWETYDFEVEEVLDAGAHVVVMLCERGRAKGTGAEVDHRFAQVWTLRDGRVVLWRAYAVREEALAALGCPDE